MHDERQQAELLKAQRKMREAYSASNELGDETESQVECIIMVPKPDPNEPPPLSPSDRVWGQGFWVGCICGAVMLVSVCGMAWLAVKGIDAGFWWMGKLIGGGL